MTTIHYGSLQEKEADPKMKAKKKSLLDTEVFQDFADLSGTRFQFRISQVQQAALSRASGHLPQPAKQLELVAEKKAKDSRTFPACMYPIQLLKLGMGEPVYR